MTIEMNISKNDFHKLGYFEKFKLIKKLYFDLKGKNLKYALDYGLPIVNQVINIEDEHFFGPGESEPVLVVSKYIIEKPTGKKCTFAPHVMTYSDFFEYYSIIE